MTTPTPVEVTQADREVAADMAECLAITSICPRLIRRGQHDSHPFILSYARHSTRATNEATDGMLREAAFLSLRETYQGERLAEAWLLYGGPDYEYDTIARRIVIVDRATLLGQRLPADVCRLTIAARIVAFETQNAKALRELGQASEAFASRVLWDNEPSTIALASHEKGGGV